MSQMIAQSSIYTEDDYYNLPENVRAELIKGRFYNMSAPSRIHQKILSALHAMIYHYIQSKGGFCEIYPAPFAVKLFKDDKTIVEPDISVICDPNKLTDRGCTGAPDWIIEISSPSNAGHDFIYKLYLYAEAGVKEYWIVDPCQKHIYCYYLEQDKFNLTMYAFQDRVKVKIYDDLWIDFRELGL